MTYACDVKNACDVENACDVKSVCDIPITSMASTWAPQGPWGFLWDKGILKGR